MATYLEGLTDNQLKALETVLDELGSGKAGTTSIRDVVEGAPVLGKTTTVYRYYKTSGFKGNTEPGRMYSFEEKSYIVASTKELSTKSGTTVLAFKLPDKTKAVPLGDEGYLLDKGTVYYIADEDATWVATIKEAVITASGAPSVGIFFSGGPMPERCEECGMSPISEFYNRCHSGQNGKFCGGGRNRGGQGQGQGGRQHQGQRPGGGGRPGGGKPSKSPAESKLERVAGVIRNVGTVIGVIAVAASAIIAYENVQERSPGRRSTQRAQEKSVRRQVKREGLLAKERDIAKGKLDREDSNVMNWLTS